MAEWTLEDVAARLTDAAETARRLPPVRVQGYFNTWPAFMREEWESYSAEEPVYRPIHPSPVAIEQMLETMRWVQWLIIENRHLVWMRANGYEWHQIGRRFGCNRTTAWRRWKSALQKLTNHLNEVA